MPRYVKHVNRKVLNPATGDILTDLDVQLKDGESHQFVNGKRWTAWRCNSPRAPT